MSLMNSTLPANYVAAGMAAIDALVDSLEESADPDWLHDLDFVDLLGDPIEDLEWMLATAPTPLAEAYVTGVLWERPDYRPFGVEVAQIAQNSVDTLRTRLADAATPLSKVYFAGALLVALQRPPIH